MKVAIIYTGALRTIRKAMPFFKKNVLLRPDVHVFACLQNDTSSDQESWIRDELGEHLKSLEWFTLSHWEKHRDYLLENMPIDSKTSHYLKTSGSMIEYYQMFLAYIKMTTFERDSKYDYIIRLRTDTILAKPIDFHWLDWSDSDVELRIDTIKRELVESNIELSDHNIIHYFMNTIISDSMIPNIYNLTGNTIYNMIPNIERSTIPNIERSTIPNLNDYIKKGSYILTLRKNLIYIIRRDLFYLIPCLGTLYGYLDNPNAVWWDSESQFEGVCRHSHINIHNYSTEFDDKSLYEYDEKRYFDKHFNILNPFMLFCIMRY